MKQFKIFLKLQIDLELNMLKKAFNNRKTRRTLTYGYYSFKKNNMPKFLNLAHIKAVIQKLQLLLIFCNNFPLFIH
jgi:hypothetical protein